TILIGFSSRALAFTRAAPARIRRKLRAASQPARPHHIGDFAMAHPDSFHSAGTLTSGQTTVNIFRLASLSKEANLTRLPYSLRILLENLLRCEDGVTVTADDIRFLAKWDPNAEPSREIAFMPARVLMQDFTGVPAIVDLAAMRDAMRTLGGAPEKINPLQPAELVIDHSVQVDEFGTRNSYDLNAA